MKRLFLITFLIAVAAITFTRRSTPGPTITPTPTPSPPQTKGYAFIVTDPRNVSLIPNFSEKKTSEQLWSENDCSSGISGGFYDTDNRPLGLFIANGETLRKISNSTLINGFFGIGEDGRPFISRQAPSTSRMALQTGPRLYANGQPLPLAIRNDEHARRMVAAVTSDQNIIFITFYQPESVFDGPRLEELPTRISDINKKELLNITDAINLDGGSASSFIGSNVTLNELTPIGSFFCIKS